MTKNHNGANKEDSFLSASNRKTTPKHSITNVIKNKGIAIETDLNSSSHNVKGNSYNNISMTERKKRIANYKSTKTDGGQRATIRGGII